MFAVTDPAGRDVFVWMQNAEPISMFCADETDGESLRACEQVMQSLYGYEINGTAVEPVLAEALRTERRPDGLDLHPAPGRQVPRWLGLRCQRRGGHLQHGPERLRPSHVGNTNLWEYYDYLWGLMNVPAE